MAKVPLKGSERSAVDGARVLAAAAPAERMEVSVIVRRRAAARLQARLAALASGQGSAGYMTRDELSVEHGADPADFGRVRSFAQAQGLAVMQEHAARRTVISRKGTTVTTPLERAGTRVPASVVRTVRRSRRSMKQLQSILQRLHDAPQQRQSDREPQNDGPCSHAGVLEDSGEFSR